MPPIGLSRHEAATLAATENRRFAGLIRSLGPGEWSKQTECPAWDVRAMAGHVLGMMEFASSTREFMHVLRAGKRAARGRPVIDGMTEVQVAERAHLTEAQLAERLATMAPVAARSRLRRAAAVGWLPTRQEFDGGMETWSLGYLFKVILTRDTWMHRVDICRAIGRDIELTPEHDGRLIADVVAEWAWRHGRPYRLTLTGPAGGTFSRGDDGEDGEEIVEDAVEFCRILSGRGTGTGPLRNPVPF
ncbi:maleylpyruvate isomerase family mycothiol-dependent enzyme [Thermoactinospora rubra]|uniref:maleylpyruvate isomerase family mycothiol-dependent enzyme n=1 Tax=Thermoactinospora rubra TaxID=1088767 RepID=UPI000A0FACA3|nr:maleylpyruvate isomerase family mycothiol-dependent enzyme [Thermoactinospora rubra]